MTRILYVVQTPLQLMCALSLAISPEYECEQNDFVLCKTFRDAEGYAGRLKNLPQVHHVFMVSPYGSPDDIFSSVLLGGGKGDHLIPHELEISGLVESVLHDGKYDILVFGSAAELVHDIRRCFLAKDSTSILIDDGTGSHCGSIYCGLSFGDDILDHKNASSSLTVRMRLALKPFINILTRYRFVFNVEKLCLFEPTSADKARFKSSLKITPVIFDANLRNAIEAVFRVDAKSLYAEADAVFFTLPENADQKALEIERHALAVARTIFKRLVVRVHPRRTLPPTMRERYLVDDSASCWEALLASGAINEHTVLIGFSSTAQVAAVQFFGMRPPMVLLNRLLPKREFVSEALDATARELMALYGEMSLVSSPEDEETLTQILTIYSSDLPMETQYEGGLHG